MPPNPLKAAMPNPDFPTEEQVRAWGDFTFLAMRSPRHGRMTAAQLREAFEPAVMTGQYRIFRFDGVARGLITYAFLGYNAEYRYLAGKVLRPRDWRSGRQLWITDIIAPYPGADPGDFALGDDAGQPDPTQLLFPQGQRGARHAPDRPRGFRARGQAGRRPVATGFRPGRGVSRRAARSRFGGAKVPRANEKGPRHWRGPSCP